MVVNVTGMETPGIMLYLDIRNVPKEIQHKIIQTISAHNRPSPKTVDGEPCRDCGGTEFLRTGTCHVCFTCGTSQGCS